MGMRKPVPLRIGLNTTVANKGNLSHHIAGCPAESSEELHISKSKQYIVLNTRYSYLYRITRRIL